MDVAPKYMDSSFEDTDTAMLLQLSLKVGLDLSLCSILRGYDK